MVDLSRISIRNDGLVKDLLKDSFKDVLRNFDGLVNDFEKDFFIDYYEIMVDS